MKIRDWVALVALWGCALPAPATRAAGWNDLHHAAWSAYKEGKLEQGEKLLVAAEKQARALGENELRLSDAATGQELASLPTRARW